MESTLDTSNAVQFNSPLIADPSFGLPRRAPASFRDPAGFVFDAGGIVFRQVNPCYKPHFDFAVASGLFQDLMDRQLLVRHEEVTDQSFSGNAYRILRPEPIPFISYPFEWSFSQLRDAALLTLDVQLQALEHGMSLKDASAYNVQFLRGQPVFIDTLSFELYTEGTAWTGYRQFCQHFLAPLLLMARRDIRLSQLSRVFLDGVPLDLASRLLPTTTWLRPSVLMHVHLHALAQRRYSDGSKTAGGAGHITRRSLTALIENVRGAIEKLRWKPAGTEWADYYASTNYSDDAARHKRRLVSEWLERMDPSSVWDLGANTGQFSKLASEKQIPTIAFDIDAAAVERNYVACRESQNEYELPLVLDLTNPSPSLGWNSQERQSFLSRGPAGAVLALALIHHLAISNNVPLPQIAEFMASLSPEVIVEFVPKSDSQVRRLLASRIDIFDDYTREGFERAFQSYFSVVAAAPIPGSDRTLYHLRRRSA